MNERERAYWELQRKVMADTLFPRMPTILAALTAPSIPVTPPIPTVRIPQPTKPVREVCCHFCAVIVVGSVADHERNCRYAEEAEPITDGRYR